MNKLQKEQIEGYLEILPQAHSEIIKGMSAGNRILQLDLLEECYKGALSMEELVRKTEGEGNEVISTLEDYCKLIFNIHKQVCDDEKLNAANIEKVLNKAYLRLSNSIQNHIIVKKEVLFLPYKASMWDSLESIWMAAKDDPLFDTYVVPIPYFDKESDNELGQMHYEGDKYPEYVPITDYEKYDIETRRPDIIFIHNPYDNLNSVTSIHPDYYSEKIFQYTDKLVYVPYFVAEMGIPEHLLLLPGPIYSTYVIVNSEEEKAAYIERFEDWLKDVGKSNGYENFMPNWREKFLVIGSPKYDKVLSTTRDKESLPKDWVNKIYNEDGSRKKVLFYNVSLTTLLDNDMVIDKIENTIELMKNRDDVVMLWRPHPLYEETISRTKPYLLDRYRGIVSKYVNENWGIFDDTEDLNRAIVESDMYYGDVSSVMYLFQKVKKPVMIQNVQYLL